MKTNDSIATQSASSQSSWIQQLWQRVTAPIGNPSEDKQSAMPAPTSELKTNTRSPEISPLPAMIGTQTLKAFSDQTDEYEPADLALVDLIPADLALLNIAPSQPSTSSTQKTAARQTEPALIEVANKVTAVDEFDCDDDDDEYLAALDFSELSELPEEIEKTLPDLSAFN